MENKTRIFKILISTTVLVVTLWYGELTIRSDQSIDITQSSQVIEIASKGLNNKSEAYKDIEIEIDKMIEIDKKEAKDLLNEVNDDDNIEIEIEKVLKEKEELKVIESIDTSNTQTSPPKSPESTVVSGTNLNKYVLNIISTYPTGSNKYPYLLNNDYANYNGVTENIYYKGEILAKAHPSGVKYSHCSGITFEVFFKAMQARNKALGISPDNFNNMNKDQLFEFLLTWYAANGPKSQSNIAVAVEKYGLGKRITNLENAIRGDFIDISRTNNTGHTMVFLNWIKEADNIVGIRYWSSQQSTNGINYREEYFNVKRSNGKVGNVIKDMVYIARVF